MLYLLYHEVPPQLGPFLEVPGWLTGGSRQTVRKIARTFMGGGRTNARNGQEASEGPV